MYKGGHEAFYAQVIAPLPATDAPVRALYLGCGTGFELAHIFQKTPNACVTCIDMSANMLELLHQKYAQYADQIDCVHGSYVTEPLGENRYDYAVSVMTIHHLLHDTKRELYRRIQAALKHGGVYIEGDYVVDEAEEQQFLRDYHEAMQTLDSSQLYHLDIPFTVAHQERLLREAGFREVNTIYNAGTRAIFVAGV